jgi:long-subunit fatty acid transport protein
MALKPRTLALTSLVLTSLALTSLALSFSGGEARAQALDGPHAGAASLGLAGAGVTLSGDPAALWLNPARLVRSRSRILTSLELRRPARSVVLRGTDVGAHQMSEARDGASTRLSPVVGLALPLWRRRLWLGAGYRLAPRLEASYPGALAAGKRELTRYLGSELTVDRHLFSLAAAFGWSWLGLGASLELSHTRLAFTRTLWVGYAKDAGQERDMTARLGGSDAVAVGALLGTWINLRRWIPLELAVAVRIPVRSRVEAPVSLGPGPAPQGYSLEVHEGQATVELGAPLEIRGGLALDFTRFRLLLEVGLARWSRPGPWRATLTDTAIELDGASGKVVRPLAELPLGIRLRDRISAHLGVEVPLLQELLTARVGYAYVRGATRSTNPSPVLIDLDHHLLGAGLQVRAGRWVTLAVAVAHAVSSTLEAEGGEGRQLTPLDPQLAEELGKGRYTAGSTRVALEAQVVW